MVSLFMNFYQAWDINIILSYIIEDLKNKFPHSTIWYNKPSCDKDYISEYYTSKPKSIQHFINKD